MLLLLASVFIFLLRVLLAQFAMFTLNSRQTPSLTKPLSYQYLLAY